MVLHIVMLRSYTDSYTFVLWNAPHLHITIGTSTLAQDDWTDQFAELLTSKKCLVCKEEVHLDVNTGHLSKFCEHHLKQPPNLQSDSSGEEDMADLGLHHTPSATQPSILSAHHIPQNKCAIEECSLPRHVDAQGVIHECCGYTHAMENIRRKMVERKYYNCTHCFVQSCVYYTCKLFVVNSMCVIIAMCINL